MKIRHRIGYYIGSFDPPTLAHRAAVLEAMRHFGLTKVYITVNHCTAKDFNASMAERIMMLQLLFADQGDRVVILREPLEGRLEFARYILRKHPGEHVLGIFGEDTFDKNFSIFAGEPRFDFVCIARPVSTSSAESVDVYVPVVYDIILHDADGVSSSEARRRIASGLDTSDILSAPVSGFITDSKLYMSVPSGSALKAAEEEYFVRWAEFHASLGALLTDAQRSLLVAPSFKPSQSKEGQGDKLVRHVVESLKLPLEEQFRLRPLMERFLAISYPTHPLLWRAGVYLGSFDPPGGDHANVVAAALKQGELDRITVGVLLSSRRPLERPLETRVQLARELFGGLGARVCVVEAPKLEDTAKFLRRLRDEQLEPLLAVFGATVFADNYTRLQAVDNLRYAVAPIQGVIMPQLPEGSLELDLTDIK